MEEWKECKFKDLYKIPSKNGLSKPSRVRGSGYKMINMGELFSNDRIYNIPMELVPLTDTEKKNAKVEVNDLLFARQSLIVEGAGKCFIVMETDELTVFESHIIRVRLNQKLAYPPFFYYYFKNKNSPIRAIIQHCVQAGIKASDLAEIIVKLSPLPTQQKIAAILSSLDDKIELNNKINTSLEQQVQALFKNWFVDFEPFGGKMPEWWKLGKLSDIAEIKTDIFKPEQNPDIQVEHYSLPAFDEKRYPTFEISKELKSNKFIISNDEVLVSKLNPTVKRVWRPYCLTEKSICSTEFIVYKPISAELKDYLFSIVNSSEFNDFMCSNVTGSTNSHQRTPPKTTLNYEIPIPPKEILHKFCDIVTSMYDKIKENIKQNETVSSLRDTLLPKLMNEKIEI